MGNTGSSVAQEVYTYFEKLSELNYENAFSLENINRKHVAAAVLVAYGVYVCGSVVAKFYKFHQIRKKLSGIPNAPNMFTGSLLELPGPGPGMFSFVEKKTRKYERFYQLWLGPFYAGVTLVHPDYAKVILKSSEPKFKAGGGGGVYSFFHEWLGDGLLLASGPKWLRNRRLLTPAFHFEILKPYLRVYHEATDKFLTKMSTLGNNGKESVPIYAFVSLTTLDIILRCAFSYEGDIQAQGTNDPYVAAVLDMTDTLIQRLFNPLVHNSILFSLTSTGRRYNKALKHVHGVAEEVIAKRRKVLADNPNAPKKRYLDFLDILLAARDEAGNGLSDTEIRHEVDTFLFEGHDTTASGISWTLYHLAGHPEYQEKIRDELNELLDGKDDRSLEWDELSRLPFLTQCIKESMRVHPPVPFIGRQISQDIVIDGQTIAKDTNVEVNIYGIHHNPLVWGEDHMEYKPERFHPDNMKNRDAYDFIPFSAGPRNCIGQNFAMNEEKVFIAKVLQRFEISIDPNHKVEAKPEAVTRPVNDIKLFFKPISQQ